jgi:hypothetical protein
MFHPLAFLVKLNIEMTMANLIKKIALENRQNNNCSYLLTFASGSSEGLFVKNNTKSKHGKFAGCFRSIRHSKLLCHRQSHDDGILKTEEFSVQSNTRPNSFALPQLMGPGRVHLKRDRPSRSNHWDKNLPESDVEVLQKRAIESNSPRSEDLQGYDWVDEEIELLRMHPAFRKR